VHVLMFLYWRAPGDTIQSLVLDDDVIVPDVSQEDSPPEIPTDLSR